MSKILIALDQQTGFVQDLTRVVRGLLKDQQDHLYVAFMVKDMTYTSTISTYYNEPALLDYHSDGLGLLTEEDHKKAEVLAHFEKAARSADIRYQIYNDFKVTTLELINQTTYADLLILSYQIFINHVTRKPDTSLLYQVLKGSRCPVLIIPDGMSAVKNIILTYDGKESSVFAIRAFSSLFCCQTRNKEVTILTITPNAEEEIKNERLLLDLVQQYFSNVGLQLLTGTSISGEILNFAMNAEDPLVIMGAYGRSTISNLIIPSVARRIIAQSKIPLFIAHR